MPSGGLTLTLAVSGPAVFGTKFNYGGTSTLTVLSGSASTLSFTVPAGNYTDAAANNRFNVSIRIVDNAVIEDNTTLG